MLSQEEARERLKDRYLNIVSEKTGIHRQTLYRFLSGKNINATTLEKLSDYLEGK